MYISERVYCHTHDKTENIVFNGVTGTIEVVGKDLATLLHSNNVNSFTNVDKNTMDYLYEKKFIFENKDAYQKVIDRVIQIQKKALQTSGLYDVYTICPTLLCNLSCSYCFEKKNRDYNNIENMQLDDNKLIKIFEFIDSRINTRNLVKIELFGGEPLLNNNINIVEKVFNYAQKFQTRVVSIITNGTFSIEYRKLLAKFKKLINNISITVDGIGEFHDERRKYKNGNGTFSIIIHNIIWLLDNDITVVVRINIDKFNITHIKDIIEYLEEEFIIYKNFTYYFSLVRNNENFEDNTLISEYELAVELENLNINNSFITNSGLHLLSYLKGTLNNENTIASPKLYYCLANMGNKFVFAPDGSIYNCHEAIGISELCIGKFYPELEFYKDISERWQYDTVMNKECCSSCTINLLCGGGCIMEHYCKTKNVWEVDQVECEKKYNIINNYLNYFRDKRGLKE